MPQRGVPQRGVPPNIAKRLVKDYIIPRLNRVTTEEGHVRFDPAKPARIPTHGICLSFHPRQICLRQIRRGCVSPGKMG